MNNICTSIRQSKKLIELGIDVNTADMYWWYNGQKYYAETKEHNDFQKSDIPAWSLTAMLGLIPKFSLEKDVSNNDRYQLHYNYNTVYYDDPVDAAFDMICWLKENNKI